MAETMKAGVLVGPQQIVVQDVPVPELKLGEIEIDVKACGVCGSDIHMWKTGKGWAEQDGEFHMGHEFCGVVTNPGDSSFKVGDRVTFWANLYCGECDMCRAGLEHLCRFVDGTNYVGFVCNGGYAQKFAGRARNAYKLPDTVSDVAAGLIDPLMVAYHAVKHSGLRLNDKVLVVGTGIIGHFMCDLARKAGASFVAMSKRHDIKTRKARELNLCDTFYESSPESVKQMLEDTEGGFDVVFEAVGAAETLNMCIEAVKPGGEIVMVGNSIDPQISVDVNRLVLKEVKLHGSVSCTRAEFTETINLIASGMVDAESFVTDIVPLSDLQHTFERLTDHNDPILKAVVKP